MLVAYNDGPRQAHDLFGGNDTRGKLVVYDPRFAQAQNKVFKDWNQGRNDWKQNYGEWLDQFKASAPEYAANIGKSKDYLDWQDQFFNKGGYAAQNAGLRAKERAADEVGKTTALDFADNAANFAKLGEAGGTTTSSSADFARRSRLGTRIGADFAGRDVARERSDRAAELSGKVQLGDVGPRMNALIDQLNNRTLIPSQISDAELGNLITHLNAIGAGTQLGSDKVFWNHPNKWDKIGGTFAMVGNAYQDYLSGGQTNTGGSPVAAPNTQSTSNQPPQQPAYQYPPQPGAYPSYVSQYPTGGYGAYGVSYAGGNPASYYTGPGGYQGVNYSVGYGTAPAYSGGGSGFENFSGYGAGVTL